MCIRDRFLYWYHFANGSLMPCMMMLMDDGGMVQVMRDRADRSLAALEAHFAESHQWLAGDMFTVADIMIMFPLTTVRSFIALDLLPYPNLRAYLRRVADRPAFRTAMAKADPDLQIPLD